MKPEEHIDIARAHIAEALKVHDGSKELDTASTLLLLAVEKLDQRRKRTAGDHPLAVASGRDDSASSRDSGKSGRFGDHPLARGSR